MAPAPPHDDGGEGITLDALCEVLSSQGVEHVSKTVLLRSQNIRTFRTKLPAVFKYLDGIVSRVERRAILILAFRLLYDDLLAQNIPISSGVMIQHVHRLPAVLNKHFPGYAQSGVLRMLVRRSDGKTVR